MSTPPKNPILVLLMHGEDLAIRPEAEESPSFTFLVSEHTREFIRYFIASAVALVLDTGTLWLLTSFFGINYLLSGILAFSLGLAVVYVLSVYWVFDHRHVNALMEFFVFATIGVVGLCLNEIILLVFTGGLGLYYLISKALSVIVVFGWNFAARKLILFR